MMFMKDQDQDLGLDEVEMNRTANDDDDDHNGNKTRYAVPPSASRRALVRKTLLATLPTEEIYAPGYQDQQFGTNLYAGSAVRGRLMGPFEPMQLLADNWYRELDLCQTQSGGHPGVDDEDRIYQWLCPVLYARVLGTQEAWLIHIHGAAMPYIVVHESSPALDFLVRRAWMEYQPLFPTNNEPGNGEECDKGDKGDEDVDESKVWERFRKAQLLHRLIPFAACDPPAYMREPAMDERDRDDLEQGNETAGPFPQRLQPMYDSGVPEGISIYLPPWFRSGIGLDFATFFSRWQEQKTAVDKAATVDDDASDDDSCSEIDDGQQVPEIEQHLAWRLEAEYDMAAATPYADLEILWDGKDTLPGQARKTTHAWATSLGRGIRGVLEGVGLVSPLTMERQAILPVTAPSPTAETERPRSVRFSEPPDVDARNVKEEEEEEGPKTVNDASKENQTTSTHSDSSSSSSATSPAPSPPPVATKPTGLPEIIPLMEGNWYRMTVHEYRTWLCVSQTLMLEASFLGYLQNLSAAVDPPLSLELPNWLSYVFANDRAMVGRLAHAMRQRSEKWLTLADAQAQLTDSVRAALEALNDPDAPPATQLQQHAIGRLCESLKELKSAHRACLQARGHQTTEHGGDSKITTAAASTTTTTTT